MASSWCLPWALPVTSPPCAATLPHVLRQLDDSLAEAALSAWGDSDWPALAQVCPGERRLTVMQNGAQRAAVGYGVTSLSPEWARPDRLLRGVRQHG